MTDLKVNHREKIIFDKEKMKAETKSISLKKSLKEEKKTISDNQTGKRSYNFLL